MGHYLLDVADFPERAPRKTPSYGNQGMVRRVMHNNLFLMDVTSEIRMHPAGRGGPSLTFDGKEPKGTFEAELHPGGKGFPSLKMDSAELKHHHCKDTCSSDVGSSNVHVDSSRDTPIHAALTSSTLGEAVDGEKCDPREIVRKLHVNWGHASSQQLKRAMAEADGRANSLIQYVDEVVGNCDVCKAFDSAPAIPVAGTSSVSAFNEKLQVDLLFLDDIIVLHVLDLFSRYSLLAPVRSKNPEEVWDAFCNSWIAVFG